MKKAVIILGHGSRAEEAKRVFNEIVDKIKNKVEYDLIKGAAMELAEPDLAETVNQVVKKGAKEIIIVPLFLFPGVHIQKDIPNSIVKLEKQYPDVEFKVGESIGADERLAEIMADRINKTVD